MSSALGAPKEFPVADGDPEAVVAAPPAVALRHGDHLCSFCGRVCTAGPLLREKSPRPENTRLTFTCENCDRICMTRVDRLQLSNKYWIEGFVAPCEHCGRTTQVRAELPPFLQTWQCLEVQRNINAVFALRACEINAAHHVGRAPPGAFAIAPNFPSGVQPPVGNASAAAFYWADPSGAVREEYAAAAAAAEPAPYSPSSPSHPFLP